MESAIRYLPLPRKIWEGEKDGECHNIDDGDAVQDVHQKDNDVPFSFMITLVFHDVSGLRLRDEY